MRILQKFFKVAKQKSANQPQIVLSIFSKAIKEMIRAGIYIAFSVCVGLSISGIFFGSSPADNLKSNSSVAPVYVSVHAKDNTTFSSETSATVKSIPFRSGDTFLEGSILLEFDCRVQKAELKKAIAQLEAASMTTKSSEKLKNFDAISEQELIKARSEKEIASADVDKLSALVDKCTIKAPYNGVISETMVHVGETVKPGDPLLKIVNITNLELQMQVPSSWLEWLKTGKILTVSIDEIKKTYTAQVTKIHPEIDPVSQTVKILAVVTSSDSSLLPGMSGQAYFSNTTKDNSKRILSEEIPHQNMPDNPPPRPANNNQTIENQK